MSDVVTEQETRYFLRVYLRGQERPLYYSTYTADLERVVREFFDEPSVYVFDPDTESAALIPVQEIRYMMVDVHDEQ